MEKKRLSRITFWMSIASAFLTGVFGVELNPIALVFLVITIGLFQYRRKRGLIM